MRTPDWRGAKLRADGRKALVMLERGIGPSDMLLTIPGSRARLYRAMAIVRQEEAVTRAQDPLLL